VPELQAQVQKTRNTARLGVFAGGVSIGGALYIGFSAGVLDPDLAVDVFWKLGVIGQAIFVYVTLSYEEGRLPTGVNKVEVRPSQIAGEGLFATDPIDEGAFLFNYEGERLNEDEYFRRYPDGKARYVACIGESLYIDGGDPTSGPARWINHAPAAQANVYYRKQRFGPAQNMHFYAKRAISAGEELTFDYGDDYWAALEATPVQQ